MNLINFADCFVFLKQTFDLYHLFTFCFYALVFPKFLESMWGKFLQDPVQDIYIKYFVIFGASWLYFGTDTAQPSQSCIALVRFVRYASKCQKMAALRIESFPCNHSINAVLIGFSSTRQMIQVKFKAKIVIL